MSSGLEETLIPKRNSVMNRKLLIAAKDGNLDEVRSLVRQGADVNSTDDEGNTPLHHAVQKGNTEIIHVLLQEVKDLNIENNKNETPFDIACRFPQQNIIEALGDRILEYSLKLLEENFIGDEGLGDFHNAETIWGFVDTSEAKHVLYKESQPQFETALEQEIENAEIKMKFCLEYLTKLTEVNSCVQDFSFDHANALICFVETFALCSSDSQNTRNRKEDYLSLFYSEHDRELIRDARKILLGTSDRKIGLSDVQKFVIGDVNAFFVDLKNYVKHICDELSSSSYIKQLFCFEDRLENVKTTVEKCLLKLFLKKELEKLRIAACEYETSRRSESDKEINVDFLLEKLESRPIGVIQILTNKIKTFLKTEIKQLTAVHDKKNGITSESLSENLNRKQLSSILKSIADRVLGERIIDTGTFLKTELEELTAVSYNGHQEEIPRKIFNFLTNFYPAFVKETGIRFQEFSDFRYKIMYQFHKYQYTEFEKEMCIMRSVLFKSSLAKEIRNVLKSIKSQESPQVINKNMKEKLELFKSEFDRSCWASQVRPQKYANNFPSYKLSSSLCSDEAIEKLVDQYLKFMSIVDCEKKEYQHVDLNDAQTSEVFENFKRLKKFRDSGAEFYSKIKQNFAEVLEVAYRIHRPQFDVICFSYIENNDEFSEEDDDIAKRIAQTIKSLKTIKDKYQLSSEVIISLYDKFSAQESAFSSTKILSTTSIDSKIQYEIRQEIYPDNISITVGDYIFVMQSNRVISNILKIFYYDYQEGHAEFTIEELFNDETFLKFIMGEITNDDEAFLNYGGRKEATELTAAVIKKLIQIDYVAPYIVKLIGKKEGEVAVTESDLITLTKILLIKEEGLYMNHISTLLGGIKNEQLNLHREILNIMIEQDFCMESIRVIFKNSQHVNVILNLLNEKMFESEDGDKDKVVGLTKCLLKALNSVSGELVKTEYHAEALKILEMVLNTHAKLSSEGLMEEKDLNILYARYQKGKIERMLGDSAEDEETKNAHYEISQSTFESVIKALRCKDGDRARNKTSNLKSTEEAIFLLALANMSYIDRSLKKYEKSAEGFHTLYQQIIRFALNLPNDKNLPEDFLDDDRTFSDIQKSEKYQYFLTFTDESKRYLNILHVKGKVAYSKVLLAKKESSEENYISAAMHLDDAVGICKELYRYGKKTFGLRDFTVIRALRGMSFATHEIYQLWARNSFGWIKFQLEYFKVALRCEYICIQNATKLYICVKEILRSPSTKLLADKRKWIIHSQCNVAFMHGKIASMISDEGEKRRLYQKSRFTFENLLHVLLNRSQGMKHDFTLEDKISASYICQQLGDLEKEKEILLELLNFQKTTLGKTHPQTRKTKELLQNISAG